MANPEAELRAFTLRRGTIKGHITRFSHFLDSVRDETHLVQLKLRLGKFESWWQEFEDIQSQIELLDPGTAEAQEAERTAFEINYFNVQTAATTLIQRLTPAPAAPVVQAPPGGAPRQDNDVSAQVKLPTINLPTFDGSYDQWLAFVDTFHSLIHDNAAISPIQKFHYLRSSLVGDAAQVIHSLEMSSLNYDVAWALLKERYQNKRFIVQNHIKALFDLPVMTRESQGTLRHLLDAISRHLRALKTLDQPTDQWDAIMIHLVSSKFDHVTKREWETTLDGQEMPSMENITKFLQRRCHLLETLSEPTVIPMVKQQFSKRPNIRQNYKASQSNAPDSTHAYVAAAKNDCPKCHQAHPIFHCEEFRNLTIPDRLTEARKLKLCLNCLKPDHQVAQCNSSNCRVCSRKHNTLLHLVSSVQTTLQGQPSTSVLHVRAGTQPVDISQVLLSTALVTVYDAYGRPHTCRALLDSGSQSNFITENLRHRLKLPYDQINTPVTGINQSVTSVTQVSRVNFKSQYNAFQRTLQFLVLNQITERLPVLAFSPSELKIPATLKLADPDFHKSHSIDMLLGAEIFWDLLCVGQIRSAKHLPTLQKTHFGWIVAGKISSTYGPQLASSTCYLSTQPALQQQLAKFWDLEETPNLRHLSAEEKACEEHFLSTHTESQGRFMVSLPMRSDHTPLGDSRQIALKRLQQIERRFSSNPLLRRQYSQFMEEYLQLGHMERVANPSHVLGGGQVYYLPHHPVFKPGSTNIRVVFDGSASTSSGTSLNDLLLVGPTIQEDLFSIVTRFRTHRYVLTADIVKMYRQILVHPADSELQRILWRQSPDQPVSTYRLKTVTYGTATAPYLAIRCLHQLAHEEKETCPRAAHTVTKDFYVDDLLTGAATLSLVTSLKVEITELLARRGLHLHKWNSNCPELRDISITGEQTHSPVQLPDTGSVKTLGLLWNSEADYLTFQAKPPRVVTKLSKRTILSLIAETFDPLGLLAPLIISAKILMQHLWQLKIDWDESVPMNIYTAWKRYEMDLQEINLFQIPRRVIVGDQTNLLQLHAFCDASESAYGACVYLRTTMHDGTHVTNLLCAKSRVAPLKTVSIPRLELCSAQLLAQLVTKATSALNLPIQSQHFWTDSTIALAWINSSPHLWKTFVANRTSEVQQLTKSGTWHHVRTHDNPADVLSRGTTMSELYHNQLWWHGPPWLASSEDHWEDSKSSAVSNLTQLPDARTNTIALISCQETWPLWDRYSTLSKLVSVIAYCLRFKINSLKSHESQHGPLNVLERKNALTCVLKLAQREAFPVDLQQLHKSKNVKPKSKLLTLSPILDEHGVIRVGGRLQQAHVSFDQRHPILLPAKHRITTLIIQHIHVQQLHAGVLATLASIRLKYWPLSGRQATKSVLRTCIPCFKVNPSRQTTQMGNLPALRVNPSRPFATTGVDFCGPFYIREGGPRSRRKVKCYTSIFVCFSTKAVHLELVGNLTTESFLGALKRFIGRRGKCTHLWSDNATNFVGARNELDELKDLFASDCHQRKVTSFLAENGIAWNFIPANSPHFGGLWEAAVKSSKHHLRRVVGNASLSFEELSTVLVQVESCLNSRPLTPLSSDPNDLKCLTPGHFLIGDALTAHGEPSLIDIPVNRLSRWQHVQQLTQHFWCRWSKEYLSQLQQRHKWNRPASQVSIGAMVLIRTDNAPPLQWPLGRITDTHPGHDGVVRVVTIRTSSGIFKRAVTKVCVLPLED